MRIQSGETVSAKMIRFRTLGCYPLSGGIVSEAQTVGDIILELAASRESERQGRSIDSDVPASMERKKIEGYF
jgi:sulfate adenylyltransferase subunit 2